MATRAEAVPNIRLSGGELRKLIERDVSRALDGEGTLSANIAFGRVSYRVQIDIFLDNPHMPQSGTVVDSRLASKNELVGDERKGIVAEPFRAAVEKHPLENPSDAVGVEVSRNVTSPNAERIRAGIPLKTVVRTGEGHEEKEIAYPPDDRLGEGDVQVRDTSLLARQHAGLPMPAPEPGTPDAAAAAENALMCRCGHDKGHHARGGNCTQCKAPTQCWEFFDASRPAPAEAGPQAWPTTTSE